MVRFLLPASSIGAFAGLQLTFSWSQFEHPTRILENQGIRKFTAAFRAFSEYPLATLPELLPADLAGRKEAPPGVTGGGRLLSQFSHTQDFAMVGDLSSYGNIVAHFVLSQGRNDPNGKSQPADGPFMGIPA